MAISNSVMAGRIDDRHPAISPIAGSLVDLYPRLTAMQNLLGAEAFAVMAARTTTAINPGALSVILEGPPRAGGSQISSSLGEYSAFFLSHLRSSPFPLRIENTSIVAIDVGALDEKSIMPENGAATVAFPVQLGAMGNGYTVFAGVRTPLAAEILIDLHRKSLGIMREALKLEYNSIGLNDALNEREIECLQMVGDGMKSEAIGEKLGLSVHTVNAYLGSATTKLDAVNRIQAIAKAIRLGLIG
jgi:Response regulator containing a CheY-like receiver domain and an HTH DNA-binding domain